MFEVALLAVVMMACTIDLRLGLWAAAVVAAAVTLVHW